ncbi:MAG: YhdT family protein [Eubacterium sp.]|jgi:uncharacterized membrane protein YhdT|nr:YhdT family protein [Eubacterium sp.]MCH4046551.1 YhdT family protein [Eubacterium sp.]MCH4079646.1 YhdT family protein [Eubacterium sp.]MCH4110204.1 YhdT family protein [Eubacterium sp.]MCI1308144.1 YhdT family protein [Eubacterium sp.]
MTRKEKERQIRKEARATTVLFVICFIWHVGFAYGLSGSGLQIGGLPLWWLLSTPGVFVVALVGLAILLKKVFINFSLEDDDEKQGITSSEEGGRHDR